jgi:hypothetical protein
MASAKEIPELVQEFVGLSKEYLKQETIEPAKRLGRYGGFIIGASVLFAFAALFLAIAGLRLLIEVMPGDPTHEIWSGLAYVIMALALGAISGIIASVVSR